LEKFPDINTPDAGGDRNEHVYSPNKAVRQTERQIIYNRTTQ